MDYVQNLTTKAKAASKVLARLTEGTKNAVLLDMASSLRDKQEIIIDVNKEDLKQARNNKLDAAMIDRLTLNEEAIESMARGIETIVELEDPVGRISKQITRPNGIEVAKMSIPLGVICMIYEARPNVTADASALCFKAGNAVILRCGKEALKTSMFIADTLHSVLEKHGLPKVLISVVNTPDRAVMSELLKAKDNIDLVIPRGGEGLINYVSEHSRIPVIQHFKGVCHLYVDKDADLDKALNILINGKTSRYGVCNALEGLIVHQQIADEFLAMAEKQLTERKVTIHACSQSNSKLKSAILIDEQDFGQEYLGPEISVKTVDNLNDALKHIDIFGSQHTEVICTENQATAEEFQFVVDASVVMVNASSRFSDGSELGLGAEIGIATTKLHAYGPMGLEALNAEKYIVRGSGQIRQ
ncbi:glutamate-5-semialdehyde dehydrogenase [Glaciecola sp. KUL10]|uniref:glutamate-5-semialdehyde dehydrogenase n=1 Tax=Glaciecola sp. (strain KUL10) TaxID=2161813 RepID=UPI000D782653|nr:glutamate-5-semialdehyde dehydrogenase [Glaciecola sp. KUL10]GBL03073.1 gamma-glutamyl phosphate reductase [Glaciecola sp. KUL10]